MPTVLNKHRDGVPEGAVYVGRPSAWGNPFVIGQHGDRDQVVARYREWLIAQPELLAKARAELAGKDLVCFCAPLPCHADVLLEVANVPATPATLLLRVTAPHFVAGAEFVREGTEWRCTRAAPIIEYMTRMDAGAIRAYLARKGWRYEWVRCALER